LVSFLGFLGIRVLWVLELEARGGFDWFQKKGAGPWFLYKGGEYQEPSP